MKHYPFGETPREAIREAFEVHTEGHVALGVLCSNDAESKGQPLAGFRNTDDLLTVLDALGISAAIEPGDIAAGCPYRELRIAILAALGFDESEGGDQ